MKPYNLLFLSIMFLGCQGTITKNNRLTSGRFLDYKNDVELTYTCTGTVPREDEKRLITIKNIDSLSLELTCDNDAQPVYISSFGNEYKWKNTGQLILPKVSGLQDWRPWEPQLLQLEKVYDSNHTIVLFYTYTLPIFSGLAFAEEWNDTLGLIAWSSIDISNMTYHDYYLTSAKYNKVSYRYGIVKSSKLRSVIEPITDELNLKTNHDSVKSEP